MRKNPEKNSTKISGKFVAESGQMTRTMLSTIYYPTVRLKAKLWDNNQQLFEFSFSQFKDLKNLN